MKPHDEKGGGKTFGTGGLELVYIDAANGNPRFELIEREKSLSLVTQRATQQAAVPVLTNWTGKLNRQLSMIQPTDLCSAHVDYSGRRPTLLLLADMNCTIASDRANAFVPSRNETERKTALVVGLPDDILRLNVTEGQLTSYTSAGACETGFFDGDTFSEKSSQVASAFKFIPENGCYFTAAAYTMAIYYVRYIVNPALKGKRAVWALAASPGVQKHQPFSANYTCYMPSSLSMRNSSQALLVVAHAMRSVEVLGWAGFKTDTECLYQACGDLPAATISTEDFYEALHIMMQTSSGTSGDTRFFFEMCAALMQLFPLHGQSHEDGLYRELWSNLKVRPNAGLVVSNTTRQTRGWIKVQNSVFLSLAVYYQSVMGRTLENTQFRAVNFCIPENPSIDEIETILSAEWAQYRENLALAAEVPVSVIQNIFAQPERSALLNNRHLMRDTVSVLNHFSGAELTYTSPIVKCRHEGLTPHPDGGFSIEGRHKLERIKHAESEEQYFIINPDSTFSFNHGFTYLLNDFSKDDGIAQIIFDHAVTCDQEITGSVRMIDGSMLKHGDPLSKVLWASGYAFMPHSGQLRPVEKLTMLFRVIYLKDCVNDGKHSIVLSKFRFSSGVRKEKNNS